MESGGLAPPFLTLALDGCEWATSHPSHFTLRERAPITHWIGGWVGPRAGLNTMEKRKIFCPYEESNLRHPAHSPLLYGLSYPNSICRSGIISLSICLSVCLSACYKTRTTRWTWWYERLAKINILRVSCNILKSMADGWISGVGVILASVLKCVVTIVPLLTVLTKLRGFSPQPNYTDRMTAACLQS
jgi:hypothetical protein